MLLRYSGNRFLLAERTQARAYDELLKEAQQIKADWYIGHNLGALAVAANAAKFNNAKAGFDFEDYHRGELLPTATNELKRLAFLENKYLPFLNYFSGSSAMITAAVQKDHPAFKGKVITVLNCFPLEQQPPFFEKPAGDDSLLLCWFSQTIGKNRGLEQLIKALALLDDPAIHLTLAGRCEEGMLQYIQKNAGNSLSNIHFAGILSPDEIPEFASGFDVGMALEPTIPENRNLCLTNKIFTYLLAGNAIILSATEMQTYFNTEYKVGETFKPGDIKDLKEKIKGYKNKERLKAQKWCNYILAKRQLNWGLESRNLLSLFK